MYKAIVKSYIQYWNGELEEDERYQEEFETFEEAEKAVKRVAKTMGCRGMVIIGRVNHTTIINKEVR